jgi:uncharacterized protein (TIGR03435 family)
MMTERVYPPRRSPHQLLLAAAGLAAMALPVLGQSNAPVPPGGSAKPQAYEVVSIRPNNSGSSSSGDRVNGGLFSAKNETLLQLISMAYHRLTASDQGIVLSEQITGLPRWADSERFNVEAKMDADAAAAAQNLPLKQLMQLHQPLLRAALAERFQLRAHFETRERPVYDLVVAKGGSKLKESSTGENSGLTVSNGNWEGRSYPIEWLAYNLSGQLGRTVEDKTGLAGKYSFTLHWTPDDQQGSPDAGPTLFTALEEQLGLKLVAAKGPVVVLVIDHVERPSEN